MRKASMTLSVFVLLAMLLTACGGQQNNTTIPATNVPPVTVESTATSAPEMTTTPEGGNLTTTPGVPVTGAENPSRLSNELKFSVVDQSGNKLADVSDMVLDLDNTRVSYVVVGSGGALNIGDKSVLIPWDSLTLQTASSSTSATAAQNAFVLQADPQVLQNAPTVDLNSIMPAMGQAAGNWDADIQSYWLSGGSTAASTPAAGAGTTPVNTPSVSATSTGTATSGTGGTAISTATSTTGAGTGTGIGVEQTLPVQGVALASQVLGSTISLSPGQGRGVGQGQGGATAVATSSTGGTGSATSTPAVNATATSTTGSAGTAVSTATSTTGGAGAGTGTGNPGTGVGNLQATIDDMIIETNTGMIQYLVVRTNFGSGDILIPIPLNIVQWDTTNNAFVLNTSPGMLQTAPSFAEDQFPDTTTSGWDQQFSTFWQSNGGTGTGTGTATGTGTGTGATATATP